MTLDRVWRLVDRRGVDECWPWLGPVTEKGYGRVEIDGKNMRAHRVVYQLATGEAPGDRMVCHSCDNPPCCNPNHLWLGDALANVRDMIRKGRKRNPPQDFDNNNRARLTWNCLIEVQRAIAAGETNVAIARRHGVHHSTISLIRRGRTWRSRRESNPRCRRERPASWATRRRERNAQLCAQKSTVVCLS